MPGPIQGVKVLELAQIMAGPTCGLMLADLGAEVIKIEKIPGGDDTRRFLPPDINGEASAYMMMNRNKKGIAINLKEGRGPLQGHGGSTITQQVAKLLCLLQSQNKVEQECRKASLARKIMEIPFSIAMEIKYSKDEILSVYLNRVYLGAGSFGFEAASWYWHFVDVVWVMLFLFVYIL